MGNAESSNMSDIQMVLFLFSGDARGSSHILAGLTEGNCSRINEGRAKRGAGTRSMVSLQLKVISMD